MAVTIAVCAFFGVWLDEQYPNFSPLFSVALSLFGVLVAMYLVIRQVLNMTDEKPWFMNVFLRFCIYAFLLVCAMFFVAQAIVQHYEIALFFELEKLFLFHLILSECVMIIVYTIFVLSRKNTAFAFLGTGLVRMVAIVLFIFPLIKEEFSASPVETFFLIIPYFVLTAMEVVFTIRLINFGEKNNKNTSKMS